MNNPTFNKEAEQILIGSAFLDKHVIKEIRVRPDQLSAGPHAAILKALKEMDAKNIPIELAALINYIGAENLDTVGGLGYLTEIVGSTPTTSNLRYYEDSIIEYYKRRATSHIGQLLLTNELDEVEGMRKLQEIQEEAAPEKTGDIKPALLRIMERVTTSAGKTKGVPTGLRDLDRLIDGFQDSKLYIIAARPAVGKSAFVGQISLNQMKSDLNAEGADVQFFSAEMEEEELLTRMATNLASIDSEKLKNALQDFSKDDWVKFNRGINTLYHSSLEIFDQAPMYMSYIYRTAREARRKNPEGKLVVMIDYLQLLKMDGRWNDRRLEVEEISRSLKNLARELKCPVVALSQLSRQVEQRQDKRPMMSDLRETGAIEQDADVIMFLYREDYYDAETEDKNMLEVIVAKQRNGPTGTVKLAYLKHISKIVSIDWGTR